MANQSFLSELFKFLQDRFAFRILLGAHDAPEMVEIEIIQPHPRQRSLQIAAQSIRGVGKGLAGDIKWPLRTCLAHFLKGMAEAHLRIPIADCGIKVVDPRVVGGHQQFVIGVGMIPITKAHTAKTDGGELQAGRTMGAIEHGVVTFPGLFQGVVYSVGYRSVKGNSSEKEGIGMKVSVVQVYLAFKIMWGEPYHR